MNTTRLIKHWSMGGALTDHRLRDGAASALDIHAAVSGNPDEPAPAPSASEAAGKNGLLVKPAGGGDWQPLLAGSA
jgi:hypothetical protein